MLWNASVLSTVSADTEPTVVITFDSAKYMFNVGENTTRAFLQSRQNWKKTRALFLTSAGTQRASGLPGLLMSLADAGHPRIQITGPSGLLHLMASMRKYTYRDNVVVTPTEVPLVLPSSTESHDGPVYKDDNISVFALPIVPTEALSEQRHPPDDVVDSPKRKREDSPKRPFKRPLYRAATSQSLASVTSAPEPRYESTTARDYDPANLSGEAAQAWRRLVIQSMFPAIPMPLATSTDKTAGTRQGQKNADSNAITPTMEAYSRPARVSVPPGFSRPLPVPERVLIGSSAPTLKSTVAYAIVGPRIRGKFDERKAVALGLPRGPLRAKLIKGECVTVQVKDTDGNVVEREIKPEDCIGESVTPGVVLIFDTPTLGHIPALLSGFRNSAHFSGYLWEDAKDSRQHVVRVIFHLCGDGVLEDERYKTFMKGFGPEVHHIVASRRHLPNPVTFTSVAYSQLRLHQLDSDIFPLQKYSCSADRAITDVLGLPANTTAMRAHMVVGLHPPRPPTQNTDAETHDLFHPVVSSDSPLVLPELTQSSFAEARSLVTCADPAGVCGGDVTVCPLGTGSAIPSKYRNVSATLIHIPNRGYVLLDAGEGTWGQLARKFGDELSSTCNVRQVLRELRCIFISHMHGDHHIGLAKILAMRQRLDPPPDTPLYVVGHDNVFIYLRDYAALEDLGLSLGSKSPVVPILVDAIHWKNDFSSSQVQEACGSSILALRDLCTSLGLESFRSVDVNHRTTCHGAIMKHADGWSIVYSGDTIPTQKLVEAGEDATLLIHEATMANDQAEMAAAKMHSTVGQAIGIGKRMNARNILLTHFSARYPTMPPSVMTERNPGDPTLALAFDHANIKIGDMWKMNVYMKAIEQSFIELEDENHCDTAQVVEADLF